MKYASFFVLELQWSVIPFSIGKQEYIKDVNQRARGYPKCYVNQDAIALFWSYIVEYEVWFFFVMEFVE